MSIKRFIAFAVVGAFAGGGAAQDSPPAIIEQVAFVGDPAPGIPGATIDYLTIPWIDAEGSVLLLAWLQGPGIDWSNDLVLYYGQPGNMQNILRESDPAPDMPEGVVISDLLYGSIGLSELGWLVLTPEVSGPGIEPDFNDRVLYAGPPDDLQKVIQAGDQAPGCGPTELIQSPFGGSILLRPLNIELVYMAA